MVSSLSIPEEGSEAFLALEGSVLPRRLSVHRFRRSRFHWRERRWRPLFGLAQVRGPGGQSAYLCAHHSKSHASIADYAVPHKPMVGRTAKDARTSQQLLAEEVDHVLSDGR